MKWLADVSNVRVDNRHWNSRPRLSSGGIGLCGDSSGISLELKRRPLAQPVSGSSPSTTRSGRPATTASPASLVQGNHPTAVGKSSRRPWDQPANGLFSVPPIDSRALSAPASTPPSFLRAGEITTVTRLAGSRSADPSAGGSHGWRLAAMSVGGPIAHPGEAGIRRPPVAAPASAGTSAGAGGPREWPRGQGWR
jgi:hypothetical protein